MNNIGLLSLDPGSILLGGSLLSHLFYFDELAFNDDYTGRSRELFRSSIEDLEKEYKRTMKLIEVLEKHGLVKEYEWNKKQENEFTLSQHYIKATRFILACLNNMDDASLKLENCLPEEVDLLGQDVFDYYTMACHLMVRRDAARLNSTSDDIHVPIVSEAYTMFFSDVNPTDAIHVVTKHFPKYISFDHLEQFIDFKKDPDTKMKLGRLRSWIIEVNKNNYSLKEIEQLIESLIQEYTMHIKYHKMLAATGVVETIVFPSIEFLQKVIKFEWVDAAKMLFSLKKTDIILLDQEMDAAGKEIAYIYKANEAFPSNT